MEVLVREWNQGDLEALVKQANNPNVSAYLTNIFPYPYTREDGEAFLQICKQADKRKELLLAVTVDGEVAGGIGLSVRSDVGCKSAELGYWLGEEHWGKGVAAQAVKSVCERGFSEYDMIRIDAKIFDSNVRSARVLEKCGFELEGRTKKSIYKNGRYFDGLIYALVK